jgi:TrpR-related protein YerC/YecD
MKSEIQTKKLQDLYKAILSLESVKEAEMFFRDLCTLEELRAMQERWEIVKLLDKGKTYREIADELKVSTTTVSRVALWYKNGRGGYRLVINRINHHRNNSFGKKL